MARCVKWVACLIGGVVACGDGGAPPVAPPAPVASFPLVPPADGEPAIGERVGVAMQFTWGTSSDAISRRAAEIERLRATGIRRVRIDFTWHRLEVSPGVWNFDALDAVVADLTRAGVSVLALLAYGNPVYAPNGRGGIESNLGDDLASWIYAAVGDPAPYARYVSTAVARYKDRVTEFELWNEPNVGWRFWRPTADAASYVALVRAAAAAGRAACATCRFSTAGVAMAQPIPNFDLFPTGATFLRGMFARLGDPAGVVDAVALHPYQYPKDAPEEETAPFPTRVQGSLATQIAEVAGIANAKRNRLGVWVTENGWSTNPRVPTTDDEIARLLGVSPIVVAGARHLLGDEKFTTLLETFRGVGETAQADFTVRGALIAIAAGVARYDIYTLDDGAADAETNQEAAFGLFRTGGEPKPVVRVVRSLLERYGSYRFAGEMTRALGLDGRREWALAFRNGDRAAIALWRWKDGRRTVRLPAVPRAAEVRDAVGGALERGQRGTAFDVTLGPEVVWLEVNLAN